MAQGWIKIDRQLQNHWIWHRKEPFDSRSAWIDLILMVNHKNSKFVLGNEMVALERGQCITSIRKLAERWGWSRKKVSTFLDMLEADNMIAKKSDTQKTQITLINYGVYQDGRVTKEPQKGHAGDTKEPPRNTNKNVKECIKNEKEGAPAPDAPLGQGESENGRQRLIDELRR